MKKKILLLTLAFVFAFTSFGFAAVSGSKAKPSSPPPAPKSSVQTPSGATNASGYKPSAPANSYQEKAPAAKAQTPPPVPQQSNSGFLGKLGAFGGGMLAGGLLGSMFGFGHPGMGLGSSLFGMLFDIIMLAAVFMGIRFLWNKFSNNRNR